MGTARDLVVASTSWPPWMASVLKWKVGFPFASVTAALSSFVSLWNSAKNKTTHALLRGSFRNLCGLSDSLYPPLLMATHRTTHVHMHMALVRVGVEMRVAENIWHAVYPIRPESQGL